MIIIPEEAVRLTLIYLLPFYTVADLIFEEMKEEKK